MGYVKQDAIAGVREALAKVESLLGACDEPGSTSCAIFSPNPWRPEFSSEHRDAVRLYVESWIAEPLRAALSSIDGDRSYSTELYLRGCAEDFGRRRRSEEIREANERQRIDDEQRAIDENDEQRDYAEERFNEQLLREE